MKLGHCLHCSACHLLILFDTLLKVYYLCRSTILESAEILLYLFGWRGHLVMLSDYSWLLISGITPDRFGGSYVVPEINQPCARETPYYCAIAPAPPDLFFKRHIFGVGEILLQIIVLAFNTAKPYFIPSTSCGLRALPGMIPECRCRSTVWYDSKIKQRAKNQKDTCLNEFYWQYKNRNRDIISTPILLWLIIEFRITNDSHLEILK